MMRLTSTAFVLSALLAAPAAAQTSASAPDRSLTDDKWAAFLGCWRGDSDAAGTGARVCVTPNGGGVTLTTVIGGQVVRTEARVADGQPRPVVQAGCTGTESARWSARSLRLYRSASVACDKEAARQLSTVTFLLDGPTWVDIETVQTAAGDEVNVRASRMVRSANQQLPDGRTARAAAIGPREVETLTRWTVDDVIELSAALPPDGVQAAISEAPTTFRLNAKALTAMADAGVGDRVIDLMVGLTYPSRFVVQRAGGAPSGVGMPFGSFMYDPFFAPIIGPAAMFSCYSPYAWASTGYWGSCAGYNSSLLVGNPYFYSGFLDPWNGGWVVAQTGGGGGAASPQVEGRLVNGRGYTQVNPADASGSFGGSGGSAYSGSTSSGDSGSSGSSGVSSGGYSGGGMSGGGGGDRVAVPRGPGGI